MAVLAPHGSGLAEHSRVNWTLLVSLCTLAAVLGLYVYRPPPALHHYATAEAHVQQQQKEQLAALASNEQPSAGAVMFEGAGPFLVNRPTLDEDKHPWPGDSFRAPCATIVCRRDNLTCPHTDKGCCTHWLRGLLEFLGWFFTTRNHRFVMVYGTLLAAYRNQSIFPWDKDIDIAVHTKVWDMLDAPSNITKDMSLKRDAWRFGYVIKSGKGGTLQLGRACYHPAHPGLGSFAGSWPPKPGEIMPWVDLFQIRPEGGGDLYTIEAEHAGEESTHNTVTFQKLYNISGLMLPGVDNATRHLTEFYGPNFMTPKRMAYGATP